MSNLGKYLLAGLGIVIIVFLAIAILKFNVLNDDIIISGEAVVPSELVGSWAKPIPGQEDKMEGFKLDSTGTAESINSATLLYKTWKLDKGKLIFTVESTGNKVSGIDTLTYAITGLKKNTLMLSRGEEKVTYKRQ